MSPGKFIACLLGSLLAVTAAWAQSAPPHPGKSRRPDGPPHPAAQSPVEYFRELLALPPAGRDKALAEKTGWRRRTLEVKLQEYDELSPSERELRLRATELRWYLLPLMQLSPAEREWLLDQVPDGHRPLIEQRLVAWDLLPPPLQQELLENQRTIEYFTRLESSTPDQRQRIIESWSADYRQRMEAELERWRSRPAEQRQRMLGSFHQFFELNDREHERILATLPQSERELTARMVAELEKLPTEQRHRCMESFRKFSNMSPGERTQFLHNAEQWRSMSPEEQESWRHLVSRLPPLPPGVVPPLPPGAVAGKPAPALPPVTAVTNLSR
jgi:hypothetical protein